jgi:hypothetical protein
MTIARLKRFLELKKKLFGNDMFVEVDNKNSEWIEYNKLANEHNKMLQTII